MPYHYELKDGKSEKSLYPSKRFLLFPSFMVFPFLYLLDPIMFPSNPAPPQPAPIANVPMGAPSDPNSMAAAAAAYMMAFAAAGGGTPQGVSQPPAPVLPTPIPAAPSQGPLEMTSNLPVETVPDTGRE